MKETIKDILEKTAIVLGFISLGAVYLGVMYAVVIMGQPSYSAGLLFCAVWTIIWSLIIGFSIMICFRKNPIKKIT